MNKKQMKKYFVDYLMDDDRVIVMPTKAGYVEEVKATVDDMIDAFESVNNVQIILEPNGSKVWACPECGEEKIVNYDDLAEVGIPICQYCDCELSQEPFEHEN